MTAAIIIAGIGLVAAGALQEDGWPFTLAGAVTVVAGLAKGVIG